MKILLADSLPDAALDRLTASGDEVTVAPDLTPDELPDAIPGFEVLVVRSTEVRGPTLDAGAELGLVVRAGAGTNTIDCARAAALGIFVCNVPGQNALAVAELALGLLIAVDRHIAAGTADLRAGRWNKSRYAEADGLFGRTFGIVGVGDIGIATAERATAFGMDVLAVHKPARAESTATRAEAAGVRFVDSLDELLAQSDVVSLHLPGGADTALTVNEAFLARMRDGSILLNTARGDLVDEEALVAAMDTRGIRAGLDVFAEEPGSGTGTFDSPLARHPSVVATHHIGASTEQAQQAVADGTIDVIDAYRSGAVINCVNLEAVPERAATLIVRHHDRVGVLAAVLGILRSAEINVSTMSNKVFSGSEAAVAAIDVGRPVSEETLDAIASHEHVINVSVTVA